MRTLLRASILLLALAMPLSASAAMMHATLHSPLHKMGFQHAMASATLQKVGHDTKISLTATHLPMPSVLHKMDYVVWATDGNMKENVGALKFHGVMAGLNASPMMTKIQDLIVTAENSPTVARPHGPVVLSGMVG